MSQLVFLKKYPNEELAKEAESTLQKHGIVVELRKQVSRVPFMGQDLGADEISIYLKESELEEAIALLKDAELTESNEIPVDHYLFKFTDDELLDILKKSDEWGELDVLWSRTILKQRGIEITNSELEKITSSRLIELAKPEKLGPEEISALYRRTLLLGIPGVLNGWMIWQSKKRLPNGQEVWCYNDEDRKKARLVVFVGSIISVPLCLVVIIYGKSWIRLLFDSLI